MPRGACRGRREVEVKEEALFALLPAEGGRVAGCSVRVGGDWDVRGEMTR